MGVASSLFLACSLHSSHIRRLIHILLEHKLDHYVEVRVYSFSCQNVPLAFFEMARATAIWLGTTAI